MKTWVLVKHASGKDEWVEQYKCDYAWQTGQIPGAKVIKIVKANEKPNERTGGWIMVGKIKLRLKLWWAKATRPQWVKSGTLVKGELDNGDKFIGRICVDGFNVWLCQNSMTGLNESPLDFGYQYSYLVADEHEPWGSECWGVKQMEPVL